MSVPTDDPPWVAFANALFRDLLMTRQPETFSDQWQAVLGSVAMTDEARASIHALTEQSNLVAGLTVRLRLGWDDVEVLAVLLGCETSVLTSTLCGVCIGVESPAPTTIGALMALFPPPHRGVLAVAPGSPLAEARLLRIDPGTPWTSSVVGLEPGVVWAMAGDAAPDPEMPVGSRCFTGEVFAGKPGALLVASGADLESRLAAVRRAVDDAAMWYCPMPATERERAAVVREATLAGAVVTLEAEDSELPLEARWLIASTPHLQWALSSRRPLTLPELPAVPSTSLRVDARHVMVTRPTVGGGEVEVAVTPTQRRLLDLRADPSVSAAELRTSLRSHQPMPAAHRVTPAVTLDDVVLTDVQRRELDTILVERALRSTVCDDWGFTAHKSLLLLQGPPGTGKTMTAEAIAGSLGQELLKVNIAGLVSKYIGETQKNFEQLFSVVEEVPSVLLIDEVDALFGKRTGVHSSNDRYANLETAYLLQRTEQLTGLVVMTTNLTANLDPAFTRRFDVVVTLDDPEEEQRRALWQHLLPPNCPGRDEVDITLLAKSYEMNGAMINSAAHRAAFDAAANGTAITTESLQAAADAVMRKHGWLTRDH